MKRPYLNEQQRSDLRSDSFGADALKYDLAQKKFIRTIRRSDGCIAAWRAERAIVKAWNKGWTFKDWPKGKWNQIF